MLKLAKEPECATISPESQVGRLKRAEDKWKMAGAYNIRECRMCILYYLKNYFPPPKLWQTINLQGAISVSLERTSVSCCKKAV